MSIPTELTAEQHAQLLKGGIIAGLTLTCDYCEQPAVWSTPDGLNAAVACYDIRHIAFAESSGSAVPPEALLRLLSRAQERDQATAAGDNQPAARLLDRLLAALTALDEAGAKVELRAGHIDTLYGEVTRYSGDWVAVYHQQDQ